MPRYPLPPIKCLRPSAAVIVASLSLGIPTPAFAWFGMLDKMSGPGPYRGLLFEARIVCFGPKTNFDSPETKAAQALTRLVIERNANADEVKTRTQEALGAWDVAFGYTVNRPDGMGTRQQMPIRVPIPNGVFSAEFFEALADLRGATSQEKQVAAARKVVQYSEQDVRFVPRAAGVGTYWSACGSEAQRRVAIDLGVDFWYAKGKPSFAGGEPVRFTTFIPAVTYRVFTNPKYDVMDIGVGAGRYWFTSKGFDAFDGWVVQPFRVAVHPPTDWMKLPYGDVRRYLAPVTARFALTVVPGGFNADAFAAPPDQRERIPAEFLKTTGFFYNVLSLLP